MPTDNKLILESFFCKNDWDIEKTYLDDKWWYVKKLVDEDGVEYDMDLASIDLSVAPWHLNTVADFVSHSLDVREVEDHYPILVTPLGWIMNGWHRVAKAILNGETTIRAKRLRELPPHDGVREKSNG